MIRAGRKLAIFDPGVSDGSNPSLRQWSIEPDDFQQLPFPAASAASPSTAGVFRVALYRHGFEEPVAILDRAFTDSAKDQAVLIGILRDCHTWNLGGLKLAVFYDDSASASPVSSVG